MLFPMNPKAVNATSVSPVIRRSSPFSSIRMVPARYFRSQVSINNNPLTRRYQQPLCSQAS
ncbi:hypothetical protein HanXRQr2_Chr01g0036751 [Helianthus annuus]|uniref:Uncharacterized protein n=1 Tax=Helianthus annuus TaxID=4232 RepID=A0A9K3JXE6_HELAN|nr:hypothetical protein HanXRQr2_Chr01g0036751 [Helianthus annuus]KAJ0958104.1 hypothetical protein HanPSC8_Chr01g0035291 [Helianthus annuus]